MLRTVLLLTAAVASAFGQLQTNVEVNVPFDFQVGNALLPAGTYVIHGNSTPSCVFQRKFTAGQPFTPRDVFTFTIDAVRPNGEESPTVLFNRYSNDRYFVSKIWTGRSGVQFPPSREEIVTSRILASAKPETVVLVARAAKH